MTTTPAATRRITIIGTGLIGGSIGLALKAAGLQGVTIVGHDRDRANANQAERLGAIDRAEHNLPRAVAGAGMVIIATPVLAVRDVLEQIAPDLAAGAIVTDTASTKAHVMQWAQELLPEGVNFIGGHPMAGKETMGIQHAEAGLFQGKAYCICPAVTAAEPAVKSVLGLVRLLGSEPLFMDAEEHDQYAAAVSHLPLMVSAGLFTLLRSSPAWEDLGAMASSGFHDVTRLASGDPAMSHGIWRTNREAVIHWLERMAAELLRFRDLLKDAQDEALLEIFAKAQIERDTLLAQPPRRAPPQTADPEARQTVMSMLIGGMMAEQLRKAQKLPELIREANREPAAGGKRKLSLAERIAEDVRRDLEKMEQKRSGKQEPGGREK
ncbi:MAG: prephenate dehydrogenase/arogenate dehydrogenase family protein [Dehalococcoidia bacterium]|nr:prephenate dehydrogenase/arogenate dehydrogenase family protein [Dehalococcoidia bacterium]